MQEEMDQMKAAMLTVEKEKQALQTEMQVIPTQQHELNEQQHLLIVKHCAKNKQALENHQKALAQQQQARPEHIQKAETNEWGRHLISSIRERSVGREPSRNASISYTASIEENH